MNLAELHKKLIAVARQTPSDDRVPYAFEQRVMARLTAVPMPDEWLLWARSLWCGAAACLIIAVSIGAWSYSGESETDVAGSFSHDIEQTILASADEGDATW